MRLPCGREFQAEGKASTESTAGACLACLRNKEAKVAEED